MSNDLLTQIVVALIAILKIVEVLLGRSKAKNDANVARGQNQALRDLQANAGVVPSAPPAPRSRRATAATPLPFFPVGGEAVPVAVEPEPEVK